MSLHPAADSDGARIAAIHRALGIPVGYAAKRNWPPQNEAGELHGISRPLPGRAIELAPDAAAAWERMAAAAAADGVILIACSGFRSVARQEAIVRQKLAAGQTILDILRVVAAPGYSEHHTGCAVDIGTPGETSLSDGFADTAAFAWLEAFAGQYDFHLSYPAGNPQGFIVEPWHWCWRAAARANI